MDKKPSYHKMILNIESKLTFSEKMFSRIINLTFINTLSEVIGFVLARPNSILCGSLLSLFATSVLYIFSIINSFYITGSEAVIAFMLGWIVGIIIDCIKAIKIKR